MNLKPSDLAAHLARGLAPIYLVAGDEPLLIQESLDAIRATARQRGYSERDVLDVDRFFDWSRLLEACGSMSLFALQRIVELRMPTAAPGKEGGELLVKLAERPPQDTLLIVSCGSVEWAKRKGGWFAALEAAGVLVYAEAFGEADFGRWLAARMRAAGLKPDDEALQLLAERTEGNSLAAAQDVAKLALLFPGAAIGVEQVREAVADSSRFDGFDLTERMLAGDAAGVVRSLGRVREEGVDVLELLGAVSWSLRQWAEAQAAFAGSGGKIGRASCRERVS
jgi:DNA polymerase-3 subunit delta